MGGPDPALSFSALRMCSTVLYKGFFKKCAKYLKKLRSKAKLVPNFIPSQINLRQIMSDRSGVPEKWVSGFWKCVAERNGFKAS